MSASLSRTELQRTVLTTSRALEFFSESELTTQLGYGRNLWPSFSLRKNTTAKQHALAHFDSGPAASYCLVSVTPRL